MGQRGGEAGRGDGEVEIRGHRLRYRYMYLGTNEAIEKSAPGYATQPQMCRQLIVENLINRQPYHKRRGGRHLCLAVGTCQIKNRLFEKGWIVFAYRIN